MKKLILFSVAALALTFTACKKDKDNEGSTPTTSKTKTEYITASAWKTTAMVITPGIPTGTSTDIFAAMDACSKDDTRTFKTGGTGTDDEGATKCDPADPQSTPFTWAFQSNETKILVDGTETYDILQLDASTFKVSTVMDGSDIGGTPGTSYTLTITMGH